LGLLPSHHETLGESSLIHFLISEGGASFEGSHLMHAAARVIGLHPNFTIVDVGSRSRLLPMVANPGSRSWMGVKHFTLYHVRDQCSFPDRVHLSLESLVRLSLFQSDAFLNVKSSLPIFDASTVPPACLPTASYLWRAFRYPCGNPLSFSSASRPDQQAKASNLNRWLSQVEA
jgi:hypothetical protein